MTRSIFLISLPRSGTVYTWQSLIDLGGFKLPEFMGDPTFHKNKQKGKINRDDHRFYYTGDFVTQFLKKEGLKRYLPDGYALATHMPANQHNLGMLKECGIGKLMLLVRDPRDATLSWTYHIRKAGLSLRNHHTNIFYLPEEYFSWEHSQQLSYQVKTFLPMAVNWLEGWFEQVASRSKPYVYITYFDNLRRDPINYFEGIFKFFDLLDVDCRRLSDPSQGPHFRAGVNGLWCDEFTEKDRELASELIGNRLWQAYENMSINSEKSLIGRELEKRGDLTKAITTYAEAIARFPNSMELNRMLARVLEKEDRIGEARLMRARFDLMLKQENALFVSDENYLKEVIKLQNGKSA